ncbi:MAG TPA: TfoX/Sxy family protein [Gemmatimonadales bacterium]|jgi:DNA transformation protein
MPGSKSFHDHVIDQLTRTGLKVASRPMFGGVGLYSGPLFFGIIARNDALYFKVDDTNRPDFVAAGMNPFRPFGEEGETMNYMEVPGGVLDDAEQLAVWAEKAVEVARAKKARRPSPPPTGKGKKKFGKG